MSLVDVAFPSMPTGRVPSELEIYIRMTNLQIIDSSGFLANTKIHKLQSPEFNLSQHIHTHGHTHTKLQNPTPPK
jgi:hypothetical protein